MPKNTKGKGGKNRRRGKHASEEGKAELVLKEEGQEYAQVRQGKTKCTINILENKMHQRLQLQFQVFRFSISFLYPKLLINFAGIDLMLVNNRFDNMFHAYHLLKLCCCLLMSIYIHEFFIHLI